MSKSLPRTVQLLGLVSLLNDASSEMIYPLLPSFLSQTLHTGPAFLGLLEGIAEATASLMKLASGWFSDRFLRRKPMIVAGYALSSGIRPLLGLATAWWQVLLVRFLDRVGKGVRSAPRDALLAAVASPENRGRVYGFHRAMDHAGALVGPLLASLALLVVHDLRLVFLLAFIPAACSVAVTFFVREETGSTTSSLPGKVKEEGRVGQPQPEVGQSFVAYLLVLAVFTLGNSSDAFLLLRSQESGVALSAIPLLWAFHHLVKSTTSTYGGALSDRFGRKPIIVIGWIFYAVTYVGFACVQTALPVWVLFGLYGLFHSLTEGAERALVADLIPAGARGRGFGLYHGVTGAMLLPANLLMGILWQRVSPEAAFLTGATLAALASLGLALLVPSRQDIS